MGPPKSGRSAVGKGAATIMRIRVLLVAACCALALGPARADSRNPALDAPDRFNWTLFARINAPAPDGRNRLWETWADNPATFPALPSKMQKPVFPVHTPPRNLEPVNQQVIRAGILKRQGIAVSPNGAQEVRRNKAAFDFIVSHDLYYQEGVIAAIQAQKPLDFPPDAIELKAAWKPVAQIAPDKRGRYYINRAADGGEYAWIGLHLVSKALPNWTWATFEQADNPGRCDVIGCHDAFGDMDADTPPNAQPNRGYPECRHSPELRLLLKRAGLTEPYWAYYCLKGSQVDFADRGGWPTRLGNSELEGRFIRTASCMSCHARSAFDAALNSAYKGAFNRDGTGPLGYPDPSAYFAVKPPPDFAQPAPSYRYLPMDFSWSFSRAKKLAAQ